MTVIRDELLKVVTASQIRNPLNYTIVTLKSHFQITKVMFIEANLNFNVMNAVS